ncbi:MAG: ribosome recycling factor [Candidatus Jacksonbacteria bacterium RIFOXYA2_FULL_44_7]|uniref:Ribosome recycling factor n=1 Tax=Candidatus Jacksonbacteria bacterium RIFCSPLOWO2_02_FULL_44_20 TaxID=1798460 RepID=A0A1G2AAQ4_9BACT|nr:MAG: Ribosome-recycling factor [Parcubacteria group bacterium GW2011_GWC2_44_17]KKT48941.1 MAG: Ribosome-recycling factor [Parcubacteria group bacterium GW2011_GWF2_44_17]OGY71761.1 MAG: ribosome recycling factor [Candidatus Jacksonbacteria bacterium RIFCSPHIGHO2_02_FULL_44_25]OGY72346.1 MAG: ribosome recycling factor [Candidatus Jacksonbacteria bacterium RIFCSPHIGHO2_12_FULL_44_12]OGY73944.1 MAG: ribosome recycling factor [Candidatus Jacksonbacteria bacterium RIFCSPLOWO2_02_FULL_44_20]OGY7
MITQYESHFNQIIDQLKTELSKLRTSRATPSLVQDITIEVYGGSRMHLKELASISAPEPRTIVIKPWDKSIIKDIEKGLIKSALEFNPIVETNILRIQLPELTEESRHRIVKKLHTMLEEERIKIRKIRDEAKKDIETREKNKEIREDHKFAEIEKLNETTREYTEKIDELGKRKEEEIMTI